LLLGSSQRPFRRVKRLVTPFPFPARPLANGK
jgi:hypothetical protein